jgi:hypothetical protein
MMSGWRRDAMRGALAFAPASSETKAAGEHGSAAKKPEGYLLSLDPVLDNVIRFSQLLAIATPRSSLGDTGMIPIVRLRESGRPIVTPSTRFFATVVNPSSAVVDEREFDRAKLNSCVSKSTSAASSAREINFSLIFRG